MKRAILTAAVSAVTPAIKSHLDTAKQITRMALNQFFDIPCTIAPSAADTASACKESNETMSCIPSEVLLRYLTDKSRYAVCNSRLCRRIDHFDLCSDVLERLVSCMYKIVDLPLVPKAEADMTEDERRCGEPIYVLDKSTAHGKRNAAAYVDLAFSSVLVDKYRQHCSSMKGRLEIVFAAFESPEDGSNLLLDTIADDTVCSPEFMMDLCAIISDAEGLEKLCLVFFLARHLDLPCLRLTVNELIEMSGNKPRLEQYWDLVSHYFGGVGPLNLPDMRLTPSMVNTCLGRMNHLCANQLASYVC